MVVVGGGIAGASAAARLASEGRSVLLLEREAVFSDRVRGEGMVPAGFLHAEAPGLGDVVLGTPGLNVTTHLVAYDETRSIEASESARVELATVEPKSPGLICVGHPALRERLVAHAAEVGVEVRRGVQAVAVENDPVAPSVQYTDAGGQTWLARCSLVIAADGKDSEIRRSLGLELHQTTPRVFLTGMLVDDGGVWDRCVASMGVEGGRKFYIQPRQDGLARLYLGFTMAAPRFTGPDRARRFLEAFDFTCIPHAEELRHAAPAGPCAGYPMTDSWLDRPYADRVVFVGDAAGWSDPVIGQGLGIAFRDARVLSDQLVGCDNWSSAQLDAYATERTERMRRLRFINLVSTVFDQIGVPSDQRARKLERMAELMKAEPELAKLRTLAMRDPLTVPAERFEPAGLVALAMA
ncbi:MAG: FAD-dependent oxidoreductase [Acidimicrobiales bacterium]